MKFKQFKEENLLKFDESLLSYISADESKTKLEQSMLYSLDAKGKRLRPLLLLAVLKTFNHPLKDGYATAAALEMIHTYSLIHDDLPAMDNDALRRGKPTNHIEFNEATAILAGDALLTLAFEVIAKDSLDAETKIKLIQLLSENSGYKGMVGGQQADISGEGKNLNLEEIEHIHARKTGALLQVATISGGLIAGKNDLILELLNQIAIEIGVAYQIRDDILDVIGTEEELGKAVATDQKLEKSTYPILLGLDKAKKLLNKHLNKAKQLIMELEVLDSSVESELLTDFVNQLKLERE